MFAGTYTSKFTTEQLPPHRKLVGFRRCQGSDRQDHLPRPPYWNSTSGFNFDLFIVIDMALFMSLPNFNQMESNPAELLRDFSS